MSDGMSMSVNPDSPAIPQPVEWGSSRKRFRFRTDNKIHWPDFENLRRRERLPFRHPMCVHVN